jgi:hypothetical protein
MIEILWFKVKQLAIAAMKALSSKEKSKDVDYSSSGRGKSRRNS